MVLNQSLAMLDWEQQHWQSNFYHAVPSDYSHVGLYVRNLNLLTGTSFSPVLLLSYALLVKEVVVSIEIHPFLSLIFFVGLMVIPAFAHFLPEKIYRI